MKVVLFTEFGGLVGLGDFAFLDVPEACTDEIKVPAYFKDEPQREYYLRYEFDQEYDINDVRHRMYKSTSSYFEIKKLNEMLKDGSVKLKISVAQQV